MIPLFLAFALSADPKPDLGWREFRGPDGTGHYTGPAVPEKWGPDTNVAWKTPIPGSGWSSPVIHKGKLFLTTAVPKDKNFELRVLCLDAESGKIEWDKLVFTEDTKATPQPHGKNSHASATPLVDGDRVFVHFGHMGTACYDLKGEQQWATQEFGYKPVHGNGGSPVLADGKLVVACDGADKPFVLALDAKTGKEAWKTDRESKAPKKFSFTTAQVIEQGGKKVVVSPTADFVAGYDLKDGKELWRAKYPTQGYSCICRPVLAGGLLVFATAYDSSRLIALDPDGKGDITANIKWECKKSAPNTPTSLAVGGDLYSISDGGVMVCLDAKTGEVRWDGQLKGKGYSASPVLVNGKIYATSEDGVGSVVTPNAKELDAAAAGQMKEKTFATPLPHDGALYLRTETKLYKFAAKK